jgi:hypothetical protein
MKEGSALGAAAAGTGAAITAAVASACCVGPSLAPIFLSVLSAGGLAAAAGLRPYAPWLLLLSALALGFSFRQLYVRETACAVDGPPTPGSRSTRVARYITWAAAILWVVALSYSVYGFLHE